MGLFGFGKKKKEEESYNPLDLKVTDLKEGFLFDFDMESWIVKEAYEYEWGNNFYSKEYKVDNGTQKMFLSVSEEDELEIVMSEKIKVSRIDEDVVDEIKDRERPPKTIHYKGQKFYRESAEEGYFRELKEGVDRESADWDRLISWEYYDEEEESVLTIEQWGDDEFEASLGVCVKEFQISNIIPSSK